MTAPRSRSESPRFYSHDITSILQDRNELKEKVINLEEQVVSLEEEIRSLKKEITRLSHVETRGERVRTPRQPRGGVASLPAAAAFHKPQQCHREGPQFVTDVEVTGYTRQRRSYVYVIKLTWSDGQRFESYRRYGEFFTFQHTLLQLFPGQRGSFTSRIPSLPTIDNVFSLFGRTNSKSVMEARLATINEYCQILLLHLDTEISQHPHVLSFFKPAIGDTQLPKLRRSNSGIDLSILSVYPQNIPAGSLFEEYVVLADYEATTTGEISANAGDKVKVIRREDSGWWLVVKDSDGEETGFISSEYLKPFTGLGQSLRARETPRPQSGDITMTSWVQCVVVEDYFTNDPRQLSLKKDETLVVIEKSEDGWWLAVRDNSELGWVPASYLTTESEDKPEKITRGTRTDKELTSIQGAGICSGLSEESGEDYVATATYCGEHQKDISFPQGAIVRVLEKNASGWWVVRYKNQLGMAPASFLGLPTTPSSLYPVPENSLSSSMDMGHCISGIVTPPPRSKTFLSDSVERMFDLTAATLSSGRSRCAPVNTRPAALRLDKPSLVREAGTKDDLKKYLQRLLKENSHTENST